MTIRLIVLCLVEYFTKRGFEHPEQLFYYTCDHPTDKTLNNLYSLFVVALAALSLSVDNDMYGYISYHLRQDLNKFLPDADLNKYMDQDIPSKWLQKY